MDGRLLFRDCALLHADGRLQHGMALSVRAGNIEAVGPDASLPPLPGDWVIDGAGRVLATGLVDAYAPVLERALQAGLSWETSEAQRQVLAASLSPAQVEALAAHGLGQGLLRGITSRVCQLRVCEDPAAQLKAFARAAERIGARVLLCVAPETSDGAGAFEQLLAAVELAQSLQSHPSLRGGLGWSGPLPDDPALRDALLSLPQGGGVPMLLAGLPEGEALVGHLEALALHGWLGEGTACALERPLSPAILSALSATGALGVLSARVATQLVGGPLPEGLWAAMGEGPMGTLARVGRALDGQDGAGLDAQGQRRVLLQGAQRWLSARFGASVGLLEPGAVADLVLYDWVVPRRQREGGLWDRLHQRVAWTVVAGRVVVRESALLGHESVVLARQAAEAVENVAAGRGV